MPDRDVVVFPETFDHQLLSGTGIPGQPRGTLGQRGCAAPDQSERLFKGKHRRSRVIGPPPAEPVKGELPEETEGVVMGCFRGMGCVRVPVYGQLARELCGIVRFHAID